MSIPSVPTPARPAKRRMSTVRALARVPGIGPALLLMVMVTIALAVVIAIAGQSLEQLDRAGRALMQSERLLSTLRDAETGQRGFLLTADPDYLTPYDA